MQQYISDKLTHFAGRSQPDDEARYELLSDIIRSGTLLDGRYLNASKTPLFYFDIKGKDGQFTREDYFPEPYFETSSTAGVTKHETVRPEMVCFCDIPLTVEQLRIHTSKYGRFGLAFERAFGVNRGASPVFYVARSANTVLRLRSEGAFPDIFKKAEEKSLFTSGEQRGVYFERLTARHFDVINHRKEQAEARTARYQRGMSNVTDTYRDVVEAVDYPLATFAYIFGYLKFFDPELSDDDPDNYYMEREWRVLGKVLFTEADVAHVIVPAHFVARVEADFPSLSGKVIGL